MPDDKYAVVEFLEEKSVEIVLKSWIETCDGVGFQVTIMLWYSAISPSRESEVQNSKTLI